MTLTNICISQGTVITPWDDVVKWHEVMSKPDVIKWIRWVNENICHNIDNDYRPTVGVKLRIATSMLNKIGSLSDEQKIRIHKNLTTNVWTEFYEIMVRDLPF